MTDTLVIGSAAPVARELVAAFEADFIAVPALGTMSTSSPSTDWPWESQLETWRAEASQGASFDRVVVAAWTDNVLPPASITSQTMDVWLSRGEAPLAVWFAALGVAVNRCGPGGSIVAVIERPPPLTSAQRAAETAVAEGAVTLVRSAALAEAGRGVRLNAVTTAGRFPDARLDGGASAPANPVEGSTESVISTVRHLLDATSGGLTNTIVDADQVVSR